MTDEDLMVQATSDMLDGWCGPGRHRQHGRIVIMGWNRLPGGPAGDDDAYAIQVVQTGAGMWAQPEDVLLDLRRPECRDRAVRVLAKRWRITPTEAATGLGRAMDGDPRALSYLSDAQAPDLTDIPADLPSDLRAAAALGACLRAPEVAS